ncbi:MAG TPA: hypothetical protein VNG29_01490 [Candidatus Paceibacterota bacterium]|nr:hypothetical protein [Candidatus Paceibacterota bacterium]
MNNFIQKLQSLPDAQKHRVMIVATAVVMVAIVYVWLAYFNGLVSGFSNQATDVPAVAAPAAAGSPGAGATAGGFTFLQTMRSGAAILWNAFDGKLHALGSVLGAPKEYMVTPQ